MPPCMSFNNHGASIQPIQLISIMHQLLIAKSICMHAAQDRHRGTLPARLSDASLLSREKKKTYTRRYNLNRSRQLGYPDRVVSIFLLPQISPYSNLWNISWQSRIVLNR